MHPPVKTNVTEPRTDFTDNGNTWVQERVVMTSILLNVPNGKRNEYTEKNTPGGKVAHGGRC